MVTAEEEVQEVGAARPPGPANSPPRDSCFVCGARRCSQANGHPRPVPADDDIELEAFLASMPLPCGLRSMVPLSAHPNDPSPSRERNGRELLDDVRGHVSDSAGSQEVAESRPRSRSDA